MSPDLAEGDMLPRTTFERPGTRIVRCLGLGRGLTVRTRWLPMTVGGARRTLFGGRAGILPDLGESARAESFPLMISHARALGPHAVVRVWYDAGPMVGAAEVLSYGTAGVVEAGGDRR